MNRPANQSEELLDLCGYRCPIPVIRLEARLRSAAPETRFRVIADDPVARVDIPHFCREGGHFIEEIPASGEQCVFLVTRGAK